MDIHLSVGQRTELGGREDAQTRDRPLQLVGTCGLAARIGDLHGGGGGGVA